MRTLSPRDNFVRFLKGEQYEWMPSNFDQKRFMPALIPSNIARGMVVQQTPFPMEKFGGLDYLGVDWVYEPQSEGSMERRPLFNDLDDLMTWESRLNFPNLDDYDWEGCARENEEYLKTDKLLVSTIFSGYFERLISLVGFSDAAMALIDDEYQEHIHRLFERLTEFYIDLISRMKKHFGVEYVEVHDDWGTQRSQMFSIATHNEMIVPYIKKLVDGAHANGVFVEQHSCGLIEPLIPGLISTGVDTWRGQAVNDKKKLVDAYGDSFKFGVELRPQPGMSDEQVLEMARQMKADYAGKKIWIFMARTLTPEQCAMAYKEIAG